MVTNRLPTIYKGFFDGNRLAGRPFFKMRLTQMELLCNRLLLAQHVVTNDCGIAVRANTDGADSGATELLKGQDVVLGVLW